MASELREIDIRGGESTEPGARDDKLRRVVHVILAVYLLPAVVLVLVVGGVLVGLAAVGRLAGRLVNALIRVRPDHDRSSFHEFLRVVNGPLVERVESRSPARQAGGPWSRPDTHGVN